MILEDLKKHQLIQRLHEMHLPLQYFCQKFLKLMLVKQDDEYSRKVPIKYCLAKTLVHYLKHSLKAQKIKFPVERIQLIFWVHTYYTKKTLGGNQRQNKNSQYQILALLGLHLEKKNQLNLYTYLESTS